MECKYILMNHRPVLFSLAAVILYRSSSNSLINVQGEVWALIERITSIHFKLTNHIDC